MGSDIVTESPTPPRGRAVRHPTTRWVLIFIACVLMANGLFGERGLMETLRIRREYLALAASIERLRHENERLREDARQLREDPRRIEELARRELRLIRPGEILVILKDTPQRPLPPR